MYTDYGGVGAQVFLCFIVSYVPKAGPISAKPCKNHYTIFFKEDSVMNSESMCDVDSCDSADDPAIPYEETTLINDISDENWKLSSHEYLEFPLDNIKENYVRRNVRDAVFSAVKPTKLAGNTALAGVSNDALKLLDLHPSVVKDDRFKDFASGAWIHPMSVPLAHRYGGYQFGWWAEQLGDGRAHLLGQYLNRNGSWWELQLKGSGRTPYSRDGDGRAVIRSSVREFLAAEAIDALGFRTSRCAAIVVGEELALRDQFYNGNIEMEKTAVVLRLSPNWFRFGSLEILSKRNELQLLCILVDHIIEKHFVNISSTDQDRYLILLSTVVEETAEMIAQWQSIGFAHGVMNTDNMSILSLTIDYGPFGFMDTFDPNFVPNSSDNTGMYSYKNQPDVGYNNVKRLSDALRPLLTKEQIGQLKSILGGYHLHFQSAYLNLFSKKLGLNSIKPAESNVISLLLDMMKDNKADFTMTFWELGNVTMEELNARKLPQHFWALKKILKDKRFSQFLQIYNTKLEEDAITDGLRQSVMNSHNPRYVLRNWIAQQTIKQVEQGNFKALEQTLEVLRNPFVLQKDAEKMGFAKPPPTWSSALKVSCSS